MDSHAQVAVGRIIPSSPTLVLIHGQIDVGLISQQWLVDRGIVLDSEVPVSSTFNPELALFQTAEFQLLIQPQRLQVAMLQPLLDTVPALVDRIAKNYLAAFAETQFTTIGFNFGSFIQAQAGESFAQWNQSVFHPPGLRKLPPFMEENPRFGWYFSFDKFGFRVRTQAFPAMFAVHPNFVPSPDTPLPLPEHTEALSVGINFNRDVANRSDLNLCLQNWVAASEVSQQIIDYLQ